MPDQPAVALTADAAKAALEEICQSVGLDAQGATLLGPLGDNAVFGLPAHGLVARLALAGTGERRLRREVSVAWWLAEQDFPAVRIAEGLDELVVHDSEVPSLVPGKVVASFWEEVPEVTPGSPAEIGELLRRLHQLSPPTGDVLAPLDPFARQKEHIEDAAVSEQERDFLRHRLAELEGKYQGLAFTWPPGVVHGDAHRKNVVRASKGRVLLLDLERFGIGPREWDLIIPAVYNRVGWYSEVEYRAFTDAYGFDIRQWDGYTTMAGIRELRMTAWLAARTGREPRLIPEARRRIASLRDESAPRTWVPGE